MKDKDKKHEQLIKEVIHLRQRIAEFETVETKHKQLERSLSKVNRALRALSECNQILVRTTDEPDLLYAVCRIIVDAGYRLAWVGFAEHDKEKTVRPVAQMGYERGYLKTVNITWANTERGRGPTGKAIRSGKPSICKNILGDPDYTPWRNEAKKRGYASSIALPLITEGRTFGTLNIYAAEPDAFDSEEVKLLTELADDLAYGIMTLRTRAERKQTDEVLRTERDKAQQYLDIAEVMFVALNKKGEITLINRKGNQILGYKEGELLGKNWFTTCVPSHIRKKIKNGFQKLMAGEWKLTEFYENPALTKSGTERMMAWHNVLLKDTQGNPIGTLSSGEDITERKEAEEALQESEEKYRNLVERANDGIGIGEKGIIRFANKRLAQIAGYSVEEVIGVHVTNFFMPEEVPKVVERLNRRISGEDGPSVYESALRHKDGSRIEVELNSGVITYQGKKADLVLVRDITERKHAERELRESEERFRLAFENANTGVCLVDLEGNLTRVNDKMSEIFGYTREELEGMTVNDIAHPEDVDLSPEFIQKTVQGKIDRATFEKRYIHKKGHVVTCEVSSSLVRDSEGTPLYFISNLRDITEQKRAEVELKGSETKFRELFESMSSAVAVYEVRENGNDFVFKDFNRAGEQIERIKRQDIIGKSVLEVFPRVKDFGLFEVLQRVWHSGKPEHFPASIYRDERIVGWRENYVYKLPSGEVVAVYDDITERKQAEERLRESEARFRTLFEAIPDTVLVHDDEGTILHINEIGAQQLEWSSKDLVGKKLRDIVTPENAASIADHVKETHKVGWSRFETTYVSRSGWRTMAEVYEHPIVFGKKNAILSVARDITERKQAEEALQASEERFKQFFENEPTYCYMISPEGIIIDVNNTALHILGYTKKELVGKPVKMIYAPESLPKIEQLFNQWKKTGELKNEELVIITKKGQRRTVLLSADSIKDADGNILYSLSVQNDITERKKAYEALREKEDTISAFVETSQDWIWSIDVQGIHTYSNPAVEKILGYTPADLVGKSSLELMHDEDRKAVEVNLPQWINRKCGWQNLILRWQHKNGSWRWLESNAVPIFDAAGELIGFRGVDRDITERKQAEKALRESEEKYRDLVENINDVLYTTDESGKITYISPRIESIGGYTVSEIIDRPFSDFVYQEDLPEVLEKFQELIAGNLEPSEYRMVTKAGDVRWVRTSSRPFFEDDRIVGLRGVLTDITESKQAEEELRKSEEKLKNIVENSTNLFYSHTPEHILTYLSPQVKDILGYKPEEAMVRWTELTSDNPINEEGFKLTVKAIESGERQPPYELELVHKNGKKVWVEVREAPVVVNNKTISIVGALTDITERKQGEEALLKEKIFSDTVMDSSPGLFFVFDDQGNILRWNKNVEKVTEYSAQEITKMNVLDFVLQEDKKSAAEAMQEVLNKGQASLEINVLSKPGKKIPFFLTGFRTYIENITCVVGTGFDITERKQGEEALQRSYDQLQETFISAIHALASTVEMKDQYTAGHQPRVAQLACAIAEEMGLSENQIEGLRMAGLIHDIGKIVVPAEILNKPGPLTEVQYEMIKMHPQAGYDILKRVAFPWPVARIVLQHQEMMDGSGYPQGLSGEEIMLEARILAVANCVEAMSSHRPYRPAYDIKEALTEISQNRDIKYDPAAVDACLRVFTEKGFAFDPTPQ